MSIAVELPCSNALNADVFILVLLISLLSLKGGDTAETVCNECGTELELISTSDNVK